MNSKRIISIIITFILAFLIVVTPALAGKPHFGKTTATGPDASGNLTVEYSSSGLSAPSVNATRDAVYACKPSGGEFPPYPIPYEEVVDSGGGYHVGGSCEHDVCRGTMLIPPPPAPVLDCGDMEVTLAMITYSDLYIYAVYGDMHWVRKSINGNYSATYYGYTP